MKRALSLYGHDKAGSELMEKRARALMLAKRRLLPEFARQQTHAYPSF
jgi:hypothetical protein